MLTFERRLLTHVRCTDFTQYETTIHSFPRFKNEQTERFDKSVPENLEERKSSNHPTEDKLKHEREGRTAKGQQQQKPDDVSGFGASKIACEIARECK